MLFQSPTEMFLHVKDLAIQKIRIRQSFAPGTVDYHTNDFRQVEPWSERGGSMEG